MIHSQNWTDFERRISKFLRQKSFVTGNNISEISNQN